MVRTFFIATMWISLMLSCNERKNTLLPYSGEKIPYNDSLLLPKISDVSFLAAFAHLIRLQPIDTIEYEEHLRIWIWDSDKNFILDFSNLRGKWQALILKVSSRDSGNLKYILVDHVWNNLQPHNGWDQFDKKINDLQLFNIENGLEPKDLPTVMTSMSNVQIEVLHNKKYRLVQYFEPGYFQKLGGGNYVLNDFLVYCNKQFDIEVFNSPKVIYQLPLEQVNDSTFKKKRQPQ